MKKIFLWSVVGLFSVAFVAAGLWWLGRPQVIVLSNGTRLTLLGVTYGKHNVAPKVGGRRVQWARLDTTNDTVVVWIVAQHKPDNWPNYQLLVYDRAGTACVHPWSTINSQVRNGMTVQGFPLDAYPRRSREMVLRVQEWGNRGQRVAKGRFVIFNPAPREHFPQWTADPMPDEQSDGDLDVTLTNFIPNADTPYNRANGLSANDPANKVLQFEFDIRQRTLSVTNWRPVRVVISDATGNSLQGWVNQDYRDGQQESYFAQAGLWPNEPAWKLRVEFSRTSGFGDDELWTVSNIPVRQGTQQDAQNQWGWDHSPRKTPAFAETTLNGIHVKVFPAIQYDNTFGGMPNGQNNKMVSVLFKTDPDVQTAGMRMTPLAVADDQGHTLVNNSSGWGEGNYQFGFPEPRKVQWLNITVAVHKSRFVEFMVKPARR